jgi:micrococcal nuclease
MLRRPARPTRALAAATVFALAATLALAVGGCGPADPAGSSAASPAGSGGQATGTTAPIPGSPERPTGPTEEATLLRVVDGDTIRVLVGGLEERVRYVGIDTPEPNTTSAATPEPYAAAATAANAGLLAAGGRLVLERDVSERDGFGRLLRHPWLEADGRWTLVSLVLVAEGFAQAATYPPDVKYVDGFVAAERAARAAGRGLWGTSP